MEIQQSPLYKKYIQLLGWKVIACEGIHIFIRNIPLAGGIAKIQRPNHLPGVAKLTLLLKSHNVTKIALEPSTHLKKQDIYHWCKEIKKNFRLNQSPFLQTKTITIDLTFEEMAIFNRFSEAKRRGVRRAVKNTVTITQSDNISDLIGIKNKSVGMFGFITTHGLKELWNVFAPTYGSILLAEDSHRQLVGGVLLLFWRDTSYYWIAGATKQGKKLFAPTLLVWEALKRSKKLGYKKFDFVGVWDERMPKQHQEWQGFTKFKEGFGGNALYYPLAS